ncbi:SDR family oxidoreductase [Streptosporangium sp. NBC_01755]|uniref:SDR family NAD(P)-dependent oxidoreductase n=1 Tax=unclassified Streptosporangium TaxID=2632669 RepID=UPI002DDB13B9|nr:MULTISPECIES: SDR family oxidoreductase [unclassified Streptosporangium]WSA28286.1 SDR family oxidoreductase [Streptosporangium sp. NBC_01810]WSD00237.1 SDR family oxidoreductase [Streptosporangium sp. NBC_01755]
MTGGARGIGQAIVAELASRGVDVMFTYRQAGAQAQAVADVHDGDTATVVAEPYDLLGGDAQALAARCQQRLGGLDIVILNAGMWQGGRIETLPPEEWWRVVETNLRGNYLLARAVLPLLRQSAAGSLVFVSSAVGIIGFPGDSAYASAKASMTGLARALAKENAGGTRVNVLAPGFVQTDMTADISEQARNRILDRTVLGRFGTVEEIARAAVFLAEDATFCTGTVLSADGGWTL